MIRLTAIIVVFFVTIGLIQAGYGALSSQQGLPSWLTNALNPAPTPLTSASNTPIPTPIFITTDSVVAPEFAAGGKVKSFDKDVLIVVTDAGEITIDTQKIKTFYLSTPDRAVVREVTNIAALNLTQNVLISLIQNGQTYAIVKFVPAVN